MLAHYVGISVPMYEIVIINENLGTTIRTSSGFVWTSLKARAICEPGATFANVKEFQF